MLGVVDTNALLPAVINFVLGMASKFLFAGRSKHSMFNGISISRS